MSERKITPNEPAQRNTQFGQPIGPRDEGSTAVDHGSRIDQSELVDDSNQGQRVNYVLPLDHSPPPDMATGGPDSRDLSAEPPGPNVALAADAPSIWDARKDDDEAPGPKTDPGDELLIDGQEEVFSRTEVERGVIQHHSLEEDTRPGAKPEAAPDPEREDGGPAGGAD